MNEEAKLLSKVLILEPEDGCRKRIRAFCDAHRLQGLRVDLERLSSVLSSNVDLGAVMLPERIDDDAEAGVRLARSVRALRPELPIYLRRDKEESLNGLGSDEQSLFSAGYHIDSIETLAETLGEHLFSMVYPNALVRSLTQMAQISFDSQFKDLQVQVETPYIVTDRLIYGEIYTLIPLESPWCRGFLMMQCREDDLAHLVSTDKTHVAPESAGDFRSFNNILGELTNLVWGAFRNRYSQNAATDGNLAQVPIVINHLHRYISFGSQNPHLCIRVSLQDATRTISVLLRFVFNLSWSPEDFKENEASVDSLVATGELEMF